MLRLRRPTKYKNKATMKSKTFFAFVLPLLTLANCGNSSKIGNDLKELKLNGRIKSIKESSFEAVEKFGEISKGNIVSSEYLLFNREGNKTEENSYKPDRSLNSRSTYEYDDKGNQIKVNSYKPDGSLGFRDTFEYDDKGNQIELNSYKPDGSLNLRWTFEYDDKGNQIELNAYKSDGSLDFRHTSEYDDKGNEIELNAYESDGSLNSKWTYKYDDKGNRIEASAYYSDRGLIPEITYQYEFDEQKNWIKQIVFENGIPKKIIEREIEYYK